MMAQYMKIREGAGDALLFYRMGDFYELFFEDAVTASAALDITLTKRGQHKGKDIPMCGVPVVAAEGYLLRLIKQGHRVAVCEQTETPEQAKKRGGKSVVNRKMVRLVTSGTLTEDTLLEAKTANRLVAMNATASGAFALAWADVSTGEFASMEFSGQNGKTNMDETLVSLSPSEVLLHPALDSPVALLGDAAAITLLEESSFRVSTARQSRLASGFSVASLDGFGDFGRAELGALLALYDYVELTQAGEKPKLHPPVRHKEDAHLAIDPATRRSLEITHSLTGTRKGSLLAAVDHTVSSSGARTLADRLQRPSTNLKQINERLDSVAWLVGEPDVLAELRIQLQGLPDLLRAVSRLSLGRGGPRDLCAAAKAVFAGEQINAGFITKVKRNLPVALEKNLSAISLIGRPKLATLVEEINKAFVTTPAVQDRDGGFIAKGWSAALDEQCELRDHSRQRIAKLQGAYIAKTGISSLKIKHNNVLGFFVELPPRHGQVLLEEPFITQFRHRQTLASAVRFSTDELAVLEAEILSAAERALALEREIYAGFLARLLQQESALQTIAHALAALDVTQSSAQWAIRHNGTRPHLDANSDFDIEHARHPVVEQALYRDGQQVFTPNDCKLGAAHSTQARLLFVTGPNMAGKSTWLRQNALLIILAQAGLFVPAKQARFGLVDRLFSRVGASDDLSKGRSTFMVEMIETAAILHQASQRSFVILDEIGRGTATWDGLALAWATAEHLQGVNGCRALFATHYHELTALAGRLQGIGNVSLAAKEWKGDLVFLHTVVAGAADRSYGIQVAKLSGMPSAAITRAKQVLSELEADNQTSHLADELPLFAPRLQEAAPAQASKVEQRLGEAELDDMSPREALEFIYELRALSDKNQP
ncbi:DNA mismatch repair protein MutS [hydrothermal vent metagenome]|uniref:DNA mismatch repair protein MutS n=1 Tax=hydrothermal vent metagenome TaxID=652676 RepID=A0A3B0SE10_9ZZZZ